MEINSLNAHVTTDGIDRGRRFDALVLLARGEKGLDVCSMLRPLLADARELTPVVLEDDTPPPRKKVEVRPGRVRLAPADQPGSARTTAVRRLKVRGHVRQTFLVHASTRDADAVRSRRARQRLDER
jgi:hypothetical protein